VTRSVEPLTEGIGFPAYALHEGFVFRGVPGCGPQFIPQGLNTLQTFAALVVGIRILCLDVLTPHSHLIGPKAATG